MEDQGLSYTEVGRGCCTGHRRGEGLVIENKLAFRNGCLTRKTKLCIPIETICNTPGTRGWSRLSDRTLAIKSRKSEIQNSKEDFF